MKKYTTINNIENYLLINIDSDFHSQVEIWIDSVSQYIDKETNRNFDIIKEERKFSGDGSNTLIIDDCLKVNSIKVNGVEIKNYFLYPENKLPKEIVKYNFFPRGEQNIIIDGEWGYSNEIPSDINFVATILVSGIIYQSLNHEGEIQSVNIGSYSVSYKSNNQWQDFNRVKEILESYKRYF
ncbi:MAG TPA: hypothetical protein PKV21_07600 [bacterium]|nr:hypothetical protein [bacterium]